MQLTVFIGQDLAHVSSTKSDYAVHHALEKSQMKGMIRMLNWSLYF